MKKRCTMCRNSYDDARPDGANCTNNNVMNGCEGTLRVMHYFVEDVLKDGFRQAARNGVWGTCTACPRDSDRHVYPEFCGYFTRYDHQLTVHGLAEAYDLTLGLRAR